MKIQHGNSLEAETQYSTSSSCIFMKVGIMQKVFFHFGNVPCWERRKWEVFEPLAHFDGGAFEIFFENLTINRPGSNVARDFPRVKRAFMERISEIAKRQDVIWEITDAALNADNLLTVINYLESAYSRACLKEVAKYGFLRVAVIKISPVPFFATYSVVSTYAEMKKAVQDFESKRHEVQASIDSKQGVGWGSGDSEVQEKKLILYPGVQGQIMEAKTVSNAK